MVRGAYSNHSASLVDNRRAIFGVPHLGSFTPVIFDYHFISLASISARPGRLQPTSDVAALFPLGYEVAFKLPERQHESFLLPFPTRLWGHYRYFHLHSLGLAGPGDSSIIVYPVLVVPVVKMVDALPAPNSTQSILS